MLAAQSAPLIRGADADRKRENDIDGSLESVRFMYKARGRWIGRQRGREREMSDSINNAPWS